MAFLQPIKPFKCDISYLLYILILAIVTVFKKLLDIESVGATP